MTRRICKYVFWICLTIPAIAFHTTAVFPLEEDYVRIIDSDTDGITLEIRSPSPEINECFESGVKLAEFKAMGLTAWASEEGKPRIPIISLTLGIPENAKLSASVISSEDARIRTDRIRPNPTISFSGEGDNIIASEKLVFDELTYSSSSPYPEAPVLAYPLGFMRSSYLGAIHIHPYQYIPASGELIYHKYMKIRIDFGQGLRLSKAVPQSETEAFESILSEALINYNISRAFRHSRPSRSYRKPVFEGRFLQDNLG
jgi:hypothetical protein